VKAVCEKHGVPYVQEGIHKRVKKLIDIMVGRASMKRAPTVVRATRDEEARLEAQRSAG
jgi:hypothetical protein